MKFFSIVVVSLNTKNDFIKTISSIEKQEYKNYEIITVDGGSIDGTRSEIIKKRKIISKIIIERDKGIYHAMNKGIKVSSGRWLIFMNSGDIFYNKKVLKNFIQKKINGYDIVYGDTIVRTKNLKYLVKSKEFDFNTCLMPFSHQSVFVNSTLLKKKNFLLKYEISSDFDFFYNCFLKKKKFKKINNIISIVKSGGLADKNRQKVFNENIMIVSKKRNRNLIYMLYLIKISQYFKNFLKIIFPNIFLKTILKKKYKNYLIG